MRYQITNSGIVLGQCEAIDEADAIDQLANKWGFADRNDAKKNAGTMDAWLIWSSDDTKASVVEFPFSVYVVKSEHLDFHSGHATIEEAREYAARTRRRTERVDGSTDDVRILDERSDEFID